MWSAEVLAPKNAPSAGGRRFLCHRKRNRRDGQAVVVRLAGQRAPWVISTMWWVGMASTSCSAWKTACETRLRACSSVRL